MNKRLVLLFILISATAMGQQQEQARWWKGNTHTHTTRSDGDSEPAVVVQWYKDHGYQFLILSDHNVRVDPAEFSTMQDANFLLIPGEEVSATHSRKPMHINGLNIAEVIPAINDRETTSATIQANIDNIRAQGGVPHINHPNFRWAIANLDLLKVKNYKLLEIHNGHPQVNNLGGSGHPSMEEVWDYLLSSGERVYGIAVDDAHHFKGEFAPERSNPGRGWVVVKAKSLNADDIMQGLEEGNFYASSGVELAEVIVREGLMEIQIAALPHLGYRTEFIGSGGKVLKISEENPAVCEIPATDGYIRARVQDSMGRHAWVQPIFVGGN